MVYVNLILIQTSLLATCLMLRGQETTQLDCLEVMCVTLGLKNKLPTLSMMLPIYC